jgi:hypothetical protein
MSHEKLHVNLSKSSCLLLIGIMILFGSTYRAASSRLEKLTENRLNLPVALKDFPETINSWTGKDMKLSESVLKTAGNDDYVNRVYLNADASNWINLYIAYSARPRTMLGHRPDVCYVASGWVKDSTEKSSFTTAGGKVLPCLIHRFYKPNGNRDELVVLNFYIVNGITSNDEELFSGLQWRTPNIEGNIARYVAQVQISAVLENTVRTAGAEFTERILEWLPDKRGKVSAEIAK